MRWSSYNENIFFLAIEKKNSIILIYIQQIAIWKRLFFRRAIYAPSLLWLREWTQQVFYCYWILVLRAAGKTRLWLKFEFSGFLLKLSGVYKMANFISGSSHQRLCVISQDILVLVVFITPHNKYLAIIRLK